VATVSGSLASKPVATISSGLASKTAATVFAGLASEPASTVSGGLTPKPAVRVSRFGPQNWKLRFSDLGLKITATVFWFGPQNHRDCFLVASQNRWEGDGVGHASRSSGLLRVEASRARVSLSGLMTGGCATAGGARSTIVEVASG
jgi:hypothetical protein